MRKVPSLLLYSLSFYRTDHEACQIPAEAQQGASDNRTEEWDGSARYSRRRRRYDELPFEKG